MFISFLFFILQFCIRNSLLLFCYTSLFIISVWIFKKMPSNHSTQFKLKVQIRMQKKSILKKGGLIIIINIIILYNISRFFIKKYFYSFRFFLYFLVINHIFKGYVEEKYGKCKKKYVSVINSSFSSYIQTWLALVYHHKFYIKGKKLGSFITRWLS